METIKEVPKEYIFQMLQNAGEYREEQEKIFLAHLPEDSRREYLQIKEGERLPDLSSDVIAKKIFSPMEHPERLEFLLQKIAQDESIKIDREAMNEGYKFMAKNPQACLWDESPFSYFLFTLIRHIRV